MKDFFSRMAKRALLSAAIMSLAACTTVTLAPAGTYAVGNNHVTLGQPWNDISVLSRGMPKEAKLLSLDGPLLNRLYLVSALPVGGRLTPSPSKEAPTPALAANLSTRERVEFVVDSVSAMGYQHVESANLRPAKFGATDAVRIDLTGVTKEGLDMRGTALIAATGDNLHLILYLAPAEHYFAASLPEVESIMAKATIG
jgi:hypothetical protein